MRLALLYITTLLITIPVTQLSASTELDAGPLDRPVPVTGNESLDVITVVGLPVEIRADPVAAQAELRVDVAEEQDELEKLSRPELIEKAEDGERAAQVVLGADFAREATMLSFAPAAANDALSDAARWYSLAASRGFPGAPSLDQSGIQFYPIRIQRDRRP